MAEIVGDVVRGDHNFTSFFRAKLFQNVIVLSFGAVYNNKRVLLLW